MTIDGFGLMTGFIGLFRLARDYTLQYTVTRTHTNIHVLVSTVTSSLPLLDSAFQRRTFPFLWVSELSPASATNFSQQQLTRTERSSLITHSLTHQLSDSSLLTN
jgi:hypothetical protein